MDNDLNIDMDAIREVFVVEAAEALAEMENAFVELERRPTDVEALNLVFRQAHTIKGSGATLGLGDVTEMAHAMEGVLEELRMGTRELTPALTTLLLRGVDALRTLVPAAVAGQVGLGPEAQRVLDELTDPPIILGDALPLAATPEVQQAASAQPDHRRARSLRVDSAKLDRMLDLTGEIAIARGRLRTAVAALGGAGSEEVTAALWEADTLHQDLQEQVMKLRMVPLGPVLRPFVRMVRDVSMDNGKLVQLEIDGEDVEVDLTVIEHLRDPLTHMLRNAIDHGIEHPAKREALGKSPLGTIILSARHERGNVVIEVADDGAGLRRDRLLARAERLELPGGGEGLSDAELHRLIFLPGFSTAEQVTELSGRGVGMDVVKRNVETLRGTVAVASVEGAGTTITIRLPLTLAIIQGFAVGVGRETYLVPLDNVTECLQLPAELLAAAAATAVLNLRGEALPLLRLSHRLGGAAAVALPHARKEHVLVVHDQHGAAGLVVDTLHGESQAVIKPLGRMFAHLSGISGSTILGNGRVALILDVPSILSDVRSLRLTA